MNLSFNPISSLPEMPKHLNSLKCVHCKFTEIPSHLKDHPLLHSIDFSLNEISRLTFVNDFNMLNLSGNKFKTFPTLSTGISYLDLSHNLIKRFDLPKNCMIQELNLSHNLLESITYDEQYVLSNLDLEKNVNLKLKLNFTDFPHLMRLNIAFTKVSIKPPYPNSLKTIFTSSESIYKSIPVPNGNLISSIHVGFNEMKGNRDSMDDAVIIRPNIANRLSIYSVIDGHGGNSTSRAASVILPQLFIRNKDKTIGSFSKMINQLNDQLAEKKVLDGATIVFAIVSPSDIGVGYLGDSRAFIVRQDRSFTCLTSDHKPIDLSERSILKSNRAYIIKERVNGTLSVSRAIGDFQVKELNRIAEVETYIRTTNDYRLVLACDGVFDVLKVEDLIQLLFEYPQPDLAALAIRCASTAAETTDNVTVIVVDLCT